MQLPDSITPEGRDALVDCLILFARHGRAIREERERQQKENRADAWGAGRDSHDNSTSTETKGGLVYEPIYHN